MQLHAKCFFFNLDETSDIYHTISHSFILSIKSNSLSSHPKNLSHEIWDKVKQIILENILDLVCCFG